MIRLLRRQINMPQATRMLNKLALDCFALAPIFLVLQLAGGLCASERVRFDCDAQPLDELLDDQGKWRSYDFVMGNCLAQRFLKQHNEQGEANIDIYASLAKLEQLIERNLQLNERLLGAAKEDADGLAKISRMRYDLKVTSAIRQATRKSLTLHKLLEEVRVQVSLADSQINGAMEECLRTRADRETGNLREAGANTVAGPRDKCSRQLDETLTRVRALCRHLDAQVALQQLAQKIYQLA